MKTALNIFQCVTGGGSNTGALNCDFDLSKIGTAIATSADKEFSAGEIEAMDATLKALSKADNPLERVYPMGRFLDTVDNSTDSITEETGNGDVIFVRDGKPIYDFRLKMGTCGWKNLRSRFHNKPSSYRFILVDPVKNTLVGVTGENGGFQGFSLEQLIIKQFKLPTGSTATNYMATLGWESVMDFEDIAIIQFGSDTRVMKLVTGLYDFSLSSASDTQITTLGATALKVFGPCGQENLFDGWSSSLANTTAFVATNSATGASIPVTTINANATTKTIEIVLDSANANFPAVQEYVTITAAAPSVLEATPINMPGFEGGSIQLLVA